VLADKVKKRALKIIFHDCSFLDLNDLTIVLNQNYNHETPNTSEIDRTTETSMLEPSVITRYNIPQVEGSVTAESAGK